MKAFLYTFFSVILILSIITTAYILSSNKIVETNNAATNQINGHVDYMNCDSIKGWAWDPSAPDAPVKVKIFIDGDIYQKQPYSVLVSDNERKDISSLVTNDKGKHGFEVAMDKNIRDNKAHLVYVYAVDFYDSSRYAALSGSPSSLICK